MLNKYKVGRGGITRDQYGREFEFSEKELKRFRKYKKNKYEARKPQVICVDLVGKSGESNPADR